jgi:hypothetical protein
VILGLAVLLRTSPAELLALDDADLATLVDVIGARK